MRCKKEVVNKIAEGAGEALALGDAQMFVEQRKTN